MKAKDYLLQLQKIDALIENKTEEKRHWEEVAMSCGVSFSSEERVQTSGNKQKMSDAVCEKITIEEEIAEQVIALAKKKQEIIATLEKLDTTDYKLLYKIYVQHWELNDVADAMEKSYSWVTTMHGRALQRVQKIIDAQGCDLL